MRNMILRSQWGVWPVPYTPNAYLINEITSDLESLTEKSIQSSVAKNKGPFTRFGSKHDGRDTRQDVVSICLGTDEASQIE